MRIPVAFSFAVTLAVCAACASAAGVSATEGYVAARKAAEAKLKKTAAGGHDDRATAQEKQLMPALEKRLRQLVSIAAPKGFGGPSSMSPATLLAGSVESGGLDGIVFTAPGEQGGRVLATTLDLLRPWLEAKAAEKGSGVPGEPDAALQASAFYTIALSPDASVNSFASVAVKAPPGVSIATAQLVLVTQDIAASPPGDLTVGVVKSDTALVALVPAAVKLRPIAACRAILDGFKQKSDAALKRYNASKLSDTKSFDLHTRLENEGAEAFRRCWIKEAPRQPGFAALQAQAQRIADAMAAVAPSGE